MTHDAIAVIDFGGQYAHLIATKIRRLHVLAEIRQPEDPTDAFRRYKGIIISGSPALASFGEDSDYNKAIYDLDRPDFRLLLRPPGNREALRGHHRARRARVGAGRHAGGGRQSDLQGARPHRARLDEPLRLGHQRRAGLRRDRLHDARLLRRASPLRRHRVERAPPLGRAVPPRSGRHGARRRDDRQLRAGRLRLHAVVDDGAVRRGANRAGAAAGWRSVGLPARLGRRRLDGGRAPARHGHRRGPPAPAARGQRAHAEGREPRRARRVPHVRSRPQPALRRRERRRSCRRSSA